MSTHRTTTLGYEAVSVGDELPELALPLTPTVIISGAIASRAYKDVHHDRDLAVQRGSKDIFMNILTTNGYVGRFVTDWAGPEALLMKVDIRLGAPNYPGDTMTLTGTVTTKENGVVSVDVVNNKIGGHGVLASSLTNRCQPLAQVVLAHAAQHDHVGGEAKLGVGDDPLMLDHQVPLETKGLAQPVDGRGGVLISKYWNDARTRHVTWPLHVEPKCNLLGKWL